MAPCQTTARSWASKAPTRACSPTASATPFDIAYHPELDAWIGGENQNEEYDEINIIRAGGNYGYPKDIGFAISGELPGTTAPASVYLFETGPAGIEVCTEDRLVEFQGDVFLCQFHRGGGTVGGILHRIKVDLNGIQSDTAIARGCTTDVTQGPDGFLYFADGIDGIVWRIVN